MEYEFFRPVIIHMTAVRNFRYNFVKRCFITWSIYIRQLQKVSRRKIIKAISTNL